MFKQKMTIPLQDTDATGVLYFASQFNFALTTFQDYLAAKGMPLGQLLDRSTYLFPVVHAEANYSSPLRLGDPIEITLSLAKIGTSSFTLHYHLVHLTHHCAAGDVVLIHVTVDKTTRSAVPIPEELRKLLSSI